MKFTHKYVWFTGSSDSFKIYGTGYSISCVLSLPVKCGKVNQWNGGQSPREQDLCPEKTGVCLCETEELSE